MPVEDFDKYMGLSKVLNNSWGTGSQTRPGVSQSIKFALRDDKLLKGSFIMIVNMPNNPHTAREMKERYKGQALQMLKGALERLKKDYQEENEGKTVRLKMIDQSVTEGLEFLTNAQYRPTLQAYYRLQCLVEVD
jgi:MinD-like ATPase involved in chromosome partitioning or flagellar assembly